MRQRPTLSRAFLTSQRGRKTRRTSLPCSTESTSPIPSRSSSRSLSTTVLIPLTVLVAEPLRGHDLGAWLSAEVVARMASVSDTLVLLYPHPAGETPEDVSEIQAIDALNRYWRKAGLVPIDEHPGFLGQSTAYTALPNARDQLQHVEDVQIAIDMRDARVDIL